jgi:hypothetical protein
MNVSCQGSFPSLNNAAYLLGLFESPGLGTTDSAGIFTVSPLRGLVTSESGSTDSITITLNSKPTADVTITFTLSDSAEGLFVSPFTGTEGSHTFTADDNWNTPMTLTVQGVDDTTIDGHIEYTIDFQPSVSSDSSYNNITIASLIVMNLDNDSVYNPGIIVTPTTGLQTTESGGSAVISVMLLTPPAADVTIPVSTSNSSEGIFSSLFTGSSGSLTFTSTDWDTPQQITVTGVNDDLADGNIGYLINMGPTVSTDTSYNNLSISPVSITNIDNDTAGIIVSRSGSGFVSEDGTTATFTVKLQSKPAGGATVSIPISSGDSTEGTITTPFAGTSGTLVFTDSNWNTTQSVTVKGVNDDLADGHTDFQIVIGPSSSADTAYNGINPGNLTFTNLDNDYASPGIFVSPSNNLTTHENDALNGDYSVLYVLLQSQPTADVTIPVSVTNSAEGQIIYPFTGSTGELTFTPGNWNTPQQVHVQGVIDAVADGNINYSVQFGATRSSDPDYEWMFWSSISIVNIDNYPGIATSNASSWAVYEDQSLNSTFTIFLQSQPANDVEVYLDLTNHNNEVVFAASGTSSLTVNFTPANWNTVQTIEIIGNDNGYADADHSFDAVISNTVSTDPDYSGISRTLFSLTSIEATLSEVLKTIVSDPVIVYADSVEGSVTAAIPVQLSGKPNGTVSFNINSSDTLNGGTVSPASMSFDSNNWDTPQTITITSVATPIENYTTFYIDFTNTSTAPGWTGIWISQIQAVNVKIAPLLLDCTLTSAPSAYTSIAPLGGGSGINIAALQGGDVSTVFALPGGLTLHYLNDAYTDIFLTNKGYFAFQPAGASLTYSPSSLFSSSTLVKYMIAPWLSDFRTNVGESEVAYELTGVAPNRTLIIEWYNLKPYGGQDRLFNFQVHLHEGSMTNYVIEFVYGPTSGSVNPGYSYASGIKDVIGSVDNTFIETIDGNRTAPGNSSRTLADYQNYLEGNKFTYTCSH